MVPNPEIDMGIRIFRVPVRLRRKKTVGKMENGGAVRRENVD